MLNCLRQPRLLCNEPPKSMRLNFITAFQVFCHPDCFRASGTESVGLAADARGVMVFAIPSRLFRCAPGLTILTRTWYRGTISSCTRTLQPSAGTGKNHATATQTATHQTAGPLCLSSWFPARCQDNFTITRRSVLSRQKTKHNLLRGTMILQFGLH